MTGAVSLALAQPIDTRDRSPTGDRDHSQSLGANAATRSSSGSMNEAVRSYVIAVSHPTFLLAQVPSPDP
jgi:hypothetical protein